MIAVPAFPIPTGGALPPGINVLFAVAACAGLVVLIVVAVRYFRRRDDD